MSKYIDSDELLKAMDTWDKFGFSHSGAFVREPENDDYVLYVHYDDMVKCVKGMPTTDVVGVVRCKDCKWFTYHKWKECNWCRKLHIPWINENGFCSNGERREDD